MGHWLYTLPTTPFTNGLFKWGLQRRFGLAAPGAGHLCGKSDTTSSETCYWNTPKPLEQLPHQNRPCHSPRTVSLQHGKPVLYTLLTDIHISEPNGMDIWTDVRIGMAKPECNVSKELARMEQEKRREYAWVWTVQPNTLFDGAVPVSFGHISCILLVTHYQMFQERCPIVQMVNNPRVCPETMGSKGDPGQTQGPWPDAVQGQGPESRLSLAFTQGVDESF